MAQGHSSSETSATATEAALRDFALPVDIDGGRQYFSPSNVDSNGGHVRGLKPCPALAVAILSSLHHLRPPAPTVSYQRALSGSGGDTWSLYLRWCWGASRELYRVFRAQTTVTTLTER